MCLIGDTAALCWVTKSRWAQICALLLENVCSWCQNRLSQKRSLKAIWSNPCNEQGHPQLHQVLIQLTLGVCRDGAPPPLWATCASASLVVLLPSSGCSVLQGVVRKAGIYEISKMPAFLKFIFRMNKSSLQQHHSLMPDKLRLRCQPGSYPPSPAVPDGI